MIFFLILMLQVTAVTGQFSSLIFREGADVTLPSGHVMDDGSTCAGINWVMSSQNPVDLVREGRILPNPLYSGRLSLTENCSLVLKEVTKADVGVYYCRLIRTGQDHQMELSILQMPVHEDGDVVGLGCSVSSSPWCRHKVRWVYEGTDETEIETSQIEVCVESVRIPAGKLHSVKCEVTDGYTSVKHFFGVSFQPSLDEAGKDATGTSTTAPKSTTRKDLTTSNDSNKSATDGWWLYLTAALSAVILILIVVGLSIWQKKKRGKKTKTDDNAGQSLNLAPNRQSAPETSLDMEDPEVSYATVSYTKRTSSKAQVKNDEDEGDSVTYSAVKVSSSSAGPPADQTSIYATVNKANK